MIADYLVNLLPKNGDLKQLDQCVEQGYFESPVFDTRLRTGKRENVDLSLLSQPTALKLRVRCQAEPFDKNVMTLRATYKNHGQAYQWIPYVATNVQTCQSVNIIYDDHGEITVGETAVPFVGFMGCDWQINDKNSLIYKKPFSVTRQNDLSVNFLTRDNYENYFASPNYPKGVADKQPIFSYGGHFYKNATIKDIAPYYSLIRPGSNLTTALEFRAQPGWHRDGIYENSFDNPDYYFHETITPTEKMTLAESINLGHCQVTLSLDDETLVFKSYKYDELSLQDHVIDIYFK